MHLSSSTNYTTPTSAEHQEGLWWLGWPRKSLLSYSMPFPALLSCPGSAVWPQARCADPRGRAAWECAVIPSSQHFFARWFRGLVANLTGIISPYLGTGGKKCYWLHLQDKRIRGRGHLSSCGTLWLSIAKIKGIWNTDGISDAPGIFCSAVGNSKRLSCHLYMIYCKKSSF